MKKIFVLLFLAACGSDEGGERKLSITTDPRLIDLIEDYVDQANITGYYEPEDLSYLALRFIEDDNISTNLSKIEQMGDKTIISFHKDFIEEYFGTPELVYYQYLTKELQGKQFECVGPMREIKTEVDVEAYELMVSSGLELVYLEEDPDQKYVMNNDYVMEFYFNEYREADKLVYDFTELEQLYADNEITCN